MVTFRGGASTDGAAAPWGWGRGPAKVLQAAGTVVRSAQADLPRGQVHGHSQFCQAAGRQSGQADPWVALAVFRQLQNSGSARGNLLQHLRSLSGQALRESVRQLAALRRASGAVVARRSQQPMGRAPARSAHFVRAGIARKFQAAGNPEEGFRCNGCEKKPTAHGKGLCTPVWRQLATGL